MISGMKNHSFEFDLFIQKSHFEFLKFSLKYIFSLK